MDLNLLNPKKAIERAFDKPNISLAVLLVLLPSIVSIIGTAALGFPLIIANIIFGAAYGIASWLVLGIVFYLIGFIIEGKAVKGRIVGILCALSLLWLVFAVMAVLGFLVVAMMPKELFSNLAALQNGQIGASEAYDKIAVAMDEAVNSVSPAILLFFTIASVALMAFAIFLVFLISRELSPKSIAKQLGIFIIFIIAWLLLSGAATAI